MVEICQPEKRFAQFMLQTVSGLCYVEMDGVPYWQSPILIKSGLVQHGFSTRKGGISTGAYASMNLSVTRMENLEEVQRNYEIALHALGINKGDTVLVDGVHGVDIKRVDARHKGDGLVRPYTSDEATFDGMVTDTPGIALITIHADCTPLFVLDPKKKAIGMCHAGWRGTVDGMGFQMIAAMRKEFGSDPEDLLCMIGPHIGACCFEVHEDVAQHFSDVFTGFGGVQKAETPEKYTVDLTLAMAYQLYSGGIVPRNVNIAHLCTCCNQTMFHSYRRDGLTCGAMASFLQLKP